MSGVCPYCRAPFEAEDEVVSCPACNTPHHTACVAENGGCTVFGCSQAPVDDLKVSVSAQDLSPQPIAPGSAPESAPAPYSNPHSIFNLNEPPAGLPPDPAPAQPAPPPRNAGTGVPPPPLPPGSVATPQPGPLPAPVPVMFAGYGAPVLPDPYSYTLRKNRVVYVLLAIFLGTFGGHNFYAGNVKRAVVQLCITIFTCGIGSLPIWIWAIVEACTVNHDSDGLEFI